MESEICCFFSVDCTYIIVFKVLEAEMIVKVKIFFGAWSMEHGAWSMEHGAWR